MNSITLQGIILTYDILERISTDQEGHQSPKDYGFDSKSQIFTELENSWGIIKSQYKTFQQKLEKEKDGDSGVSVTRKYWMDPFMSELGYDIQRNESGQIINDRNYFVSHQDNKLNGFPIHIIGANQSLDKKYTGMRMSSHAMIQEYLNHHENLYALVTNGKYLRLLRDSQLLTKVSYVEFDLHKMITEDQFSDFVLLWKLLHVTRMPDEPENGTESIIEQYHLNSLESGSRIREKLSEAVKHGITILANGLIQEEQNDALRSWLEESRAERSKAYYGELLRLIYRILFVMVIEERDLIYPEELNEDQQKKKNIYYQFYSLQRLRKLAINHYYGNDQHYDLWQYMMNVFGLYEGSKGEKLGIQTLAGDLFSYNAISHIRECQLNNDILLQVFKGLTLFENDQGQFITVNYKSLDVEEFGSVYEGLLELDPAIDVAARRFSFVKGDDRSISGSHYTPDELVQPLIKHSLEHLIQDIVKPIYEEETKSKKINREKRDSAIADLLKLTVCDVACGSGHILLAAARRIGLEVARLRSGEEQPNPSEARKGTRDAIKHCIYGVDKNLLAVELCKVAMWLEAHVPGEPLNFLDHKIKNGDAIVGLARMEELYSGIATEAFKAYKDEEIENCRILKASNKKERKAREAGQLRLHNVKEIVENKLKGYKEKFEAFAALPENTIQEIESKKKAHKKLNSGGSYWFVKGLADLQVAQFFVDKSEMANVATDDDYFDIMAGRKTQTKAEVMALAESTKRNFFHWFLEFPEVFAQGGFSTILGNPPYLGFKKITQKYGPSYNIYIKTIWPEKGKSDFVAYFFRRIFNIICSGGFQSLISTNTVSEGDTRIVGLESLINHGGEINFALKNIKWPGKAAVFVSIISITKSSNVRIAKILNDKPTQYISSFLNDEEYSDPEQLEIYKDQYFQGSVIRGNGFLLDKKQAEYFVQENSQNAEVIKKYYSGSDLNGNYQLDTDRYVIDFQAWSLDKVEEYYDLYSIVKEKVKPERENILAASNQVHENDYWIFWDRREELYQKLSRLNSGFAISMQAAKYCLFNVIDSNCICSNSLGIITSDNFSLFMQLNSSFHNAWAWRYGSRMKNDLRYSSSDIFYTFPFFKIEFKAGLGERLLQKRRDLFESIKLGSTKSYNQFHNRDLSEDSAKDISGLPNTAIKKELTKESWNLYNHLQKTEGTISFSEAAEKVVELRKLHMEMDLTVLEAYGWHQDTKRWGSSIDLRHDFYEVDYLPENDWVRYTIHPDARKEVLNRLLLLNHEIHESEERGISYEELDKEKIMEIYQEEIGIWLDKPEVLHPKTLKFLSSGEDLLPDIDKSLAKSYKPFVLQYCSALENELQSKLFIAWNEKFQAEWQDDEDGKKAYLKEQGDLVPKIRMMCGALKKNDDKYTLGNMHFFLNIIWNPNSNTVKDSSLIQDFKSHAYSVYSEQFINKETVAELDIIKEYRNKAGHTDEVDKGMAEECRKAVREFINLVVKSEIQ